MRADASTGERARSGTPAVGCGWLERGEQRPARLAPFAGVQGCRRRLPRRAGGLLRLAGVEHLELGDQQEPDEQHEAVVSGGDHHDAAAPSVAAIEK